MSREPKSKNQVDINFVFDDSDSEGLIFTEGLAKQGLPELEMRNIPRFLANAAVDILNQVRFHMSSTGRRVYEEEMVTLFDGTRVRLIKAEPMAGEEFLYEDERLQVVSGDY